MAEAVIAVVVACVSMTGMQWGVDDYHVMIYGAGAPARPAVINWPPTCALGNIGASSLKKRTLGLERRHMRRIEREPRAS